MFEQFYSHLNMVLKHMKMGPKHRKPVYCCSSVCMNTLIIINSCAKKKKCLGKSLCTSLDKISTNQSPCLINRLYPPPQTCMFKGTYQFLLLHLVCNCNPSSTPAMLTRREITNRRPIQTQTPFRAGKSVFQMGFLSRRRLLS